MLYLRPLLTRKVLVLKSAQHRARYLRIIVRTRPLCIDGVVCRKQVAVLVDRSNGKNLQFGFLHRTVTGCPVV